MLSDQASDLKNILSKEIIASMDISYSKETAAFIESLKKDGIVITKDINSTYKDDQTALMMAAEQGKTKTVLMLIAAGADVNFKNKDSQTALMMAAEKGHAETTEMLIAMVADIHTKDKDGQTALMMAAEKGHTETAAMLIENGANLHVLNENGQTALMIAAAYGHTETAAMLIEKDADVNVLDIKQKRALLNNAISAGNNNLVTKLLTVRQTPEKLHELIAGISEEQKLKIIEPIKQAFTQLANEKRGNSAAKLIEHFPTTDLAEVKKLKGLLQNDVGLEKLKHDPNTKRKNNRIADATKKLPSNWWPFLF